MTEVAAVDVGTFLAEAGPLLLADEARHNLALGLAGTVRDDPDVYADPRFWLVLDGDDVVGAALRTPPHHVVVARPHTDAALEALAAELDDEPPGAVAAVPEIDAFAETWTARRGGTVRVVFDQGLFALEHVVDLARPAGRLRDATRDDQDLLVEWVLAFAAEALHGAESSVADAQRLVGNRLDSPHAGIVLWEVDGEPVSLASFGGRTPNGIRIGPVYTPPAARGHGYATALVADCSRRLLASGRRFCFLYTDLANPTANAIYERIGYVRVCTSRQVAFD